MKKKKPFPEKQKLTEFIANRPTQEMKSIVNGKNENTFKIPFFMLIVLKDNCLKKNNNKI